MARAKKQEEIEEVHSPDFALAVRIWRQDIKPAISNQATHAQEASEGYKTIKKRAYIQPQAAKIAFKLDGMEESKRDDFLRSFNGLLRELNIFMPRDLADIAEGKGTASETVVPTGERPKPKLVTVPTGPEADDLLASAADEVKAETEADAANHFVAKARAHLNPSAAEPQAAE